MAVYEGVFRYVLALIKKPLSDEELEKLCLDRLQDFLQARKYSVNSHTSK